MLMKSLKDMKIGVRLNLILSIVTVIIFTGFGIYTFYSQKEELWKMPTRECMNN